ncbi:MAG: hypothetical protein IPN33_01995 [Saprospiraceae bacterium]|nr:hypothetical protein [Saprospiraceae bacterium]
MAQDDIVVQSVSGKALYYAPQESKAQNVYPGMRLSSNGKIRCQSGATVKLLQNGEIFLIKGSKQCTVCVSWASNQVAALIWALWGVFLNSFRAA